MTGPVLSIISDFFGPEEESIPRLAQIGYRRVEVKRRSSTGYRAHELRRICDKYGVEIHSVMGSDRGLVSPEPQTRAQRLEALKDAIRWAEELGAQIVETVPMWHASEGDSYPQAWRRAKEILSQAADFAAERGIILALEPVNKRESRLINTMAQASRFCREVNSPHLQVMGDLHHMAMEEKDLLRAISSVAARHVHFHFSDNDRLPPGLGHLDLKAVVMRLFETGYQGSLSLSEVARFPDAETAARISYTYTSALLEVCRLPAQEGVQ